MFERTYNRGNAHDLAAIAEHPQRIQQALELAEQGCSEQALQCTAKAVEWSPDRQILARHLVNGVFPSIGRATALATGPQERALGQDLRRSLTVVPGVKRPHPASRSNQPPASASLAVQSQEPAWLFHCRVEIDGQAYQVGFMPASPEPYRVQDGILYFELPPGEPGYLVSNESGDFNQAPGVNQLPLEADTPYEIAGEIPCTCEVNPFVWVFEYSKRSKIRGKSFRTDGGKLQEYFRTSRKSDGFVVGVRLEGRGSLRLDAAALLMKKSADINAIGRSWIKRVCVDEYDSQRFTRFNERPVEFAFLFRIISRFYPKDILDVGTGLTALPHLMRNCGAVVTATDNVEDYWTEEIFNRHYHIINDDITRTSLTATYDLISCISTLEHIEKFDEAIYCMSRLLKPGGLLVVTFPYNEGRYCKNVYKLKGSSYGQTAPYITQAYSRKEVTRWESEFNLELVEQEYWQYWSGEYWTQDQQMIPPVKAHADSRHQLSCLLFRKVP